jgi:hypothetical protein
MADQPTIQELCNYVAGHRHAKKHIKIKNVKMEIKTFQVFFAENGDLKMTIYIEEDEEDLYYGEKLHRARYVGPHLLHLCSELINQYRRHTAFEFVKNLFN